jgi:hypothetical protein
MTTPRTGLEKAALIAEVLGGVAVVVSVIYLGVQISDNTKTLRSQTHYSALEALQRPFEMMLESDLLSQQLVLCRDGPYSVEESVWARCHNYYFMQANGWEYTYYQEVDEALPPSLWPGVDGYMGNEARTNPGWVRFWEESSDGFGEPFRSYIEQRIQENPAYGQPRR